MRKVVVLAIALLGLLVVAPVSPASANSFQGACAVSGNAVFPDPALGGTPLKATPATTSYRFDTNNTFPGGDRCVGSLNGVAGSYPVSAATASGRGTLSCVAASAGTPIDGQAVGNGSITIGGVTFNFTVQLVGAGTEVVFVLSQNGSPSAVGHASFANPANTGAAAGCAGAGVSSLHFDIEAASVTLS
jgi:hypothetical protein